MLSFVLVHSPVVGPATWAWVARSLRARGHAVTVPTVTGEVTARGWPAVVEAVLHQADAAGPVVLVGHSGAGPLLAQIAAGLADEPTGLVLVDAGIWSDSGPTALMPDDLMAELRAAATDGLLPVWSDWWGEDIVRDLIPDDERRALVCAEQPRVPVSYFEAQVPTPLGVGLGRCGYVLLSEPYAADAAEAVRRGWTLVELPGAHLDLVTRPEEVAGAILEALG